MGDESHLRRLRGFRLLETPQRSEREQGEDAKLLSIFDEDPFEAPCRLCGTPTQITLLAGCLRRDCSGCGDMVVLEIQPMRR